MEGGTSNPYEKQLLAVFDSCLEEGDTKISANGLQTLCDKLQLDEQSDELIARLEERKETLISFKTFRDELVKLLGQGTHGLIGKEDDDSLGHEVGVVSNKYRLQVSRLHNTNTMAGKINGGMNGDHSEMCTLSTIGYSQTAPKEWLEQIFEKLDMDCDGLISFDEFILLFENEKNTHEHLSLDWANGSSGDVVKPRDIVHIRGPHQTGYESISTIVTMWEVAGVADAAALLSDLGFTSSEIRLTDLTTALCEELKNLRDEPDNAITVTHMSLLKGALTLYQEEVRSMITLNEQLSGERDKLRIDVAAANERANQLANEIDEHHVRLEKSRQEQLKQLELRHAEITKDLSIQCTSEREAHTEALKALDRQLQVVQQKEQQVSAKLATVLHENLNLEAEVDSLTDQVAKLKSSNRELLQQVQNLAAEHEEIDTSDDTRESEQVILLVERIKKLQADVALLRDQNDELTTELEFMKTRYAEPAATIVEARPAEKSLPEQSVAFLELGQAAANGWSRSDDSKLADPSNAIESIARKLKTLLNAKTPCAPDHCAAISNISSIIAELEARLSETRSTTETRDEIDAGDARENDLEVECEERASESLRDLVVSQTETAKLVRRVSHSSDDTINNIDKNFNNLDTKSATKSKITSLRDYPPRKDETASAEGSRTERERSGNLAFNVTQSPETEENARDSLNAMIQELEAKHQAEKKQLSERCAELERSVDLLRTEYEQCEDYWAAKLEEERQLFEQEQKISDDKFSELIAKMAEYEEQFSPGEKARNDGRLSPIEERFNLEQQYADLEEECEELRSQIAELARQKDTEISELQERLTSVRSARASTSDVTTQFPLDETPADGVPKPQAFSTPLQLAAVAATTTHSSGEPQSYAAATTASPATAKKIVHHATSNYRVFDPSKLNQIAESAISNNSLFASPAPRLPDCYCQQIEAYASMQELCRVHKTELNRLYQKKLEIDNECLNLSKQKETLIKGVSELKNVTSNGCIYNEGDGDDAACRMSISVVKALYERLQAQEKKRRSLKISLTHHQQHAERVLQQTWQQHCQEVTALRFALQKTEEKLKLQVKVNQEQADRLAKADILSTDLYVQNAHLVASVKRLEHHCFAMAQFSAESTSV